MSISKPFTFTAGTRARASEVNQDFDTLYTEANRVANEAITLSTEIQRLDEEKANINGSSTRRFQVADAVNSGDAMNKQMVDKLTYNSRDYISGLIITKDSGSPNDTVIVDSGSCYDTTHTTMIIKQTSTTKQNGNQGANTTYYIHLISDDTGNTTDILISTVKNSPPLPTNYTKYRRLGSYTTNNDSHIETINNITNRFEYSYLPDYSKAIAITLPYTVLKDGFVYGGVDGIDSAQYIYVNNHVVLGHCGYSGGKWVYSGSTFMVNKGDVVTASRASGSYFFYPLKGEE